MDDNEDGERVGIGELGTDEDWYEFESIEISLCTCLFVVFSFNIYFPFFRCDGETILIFSVCITPSSNANSGNNSVFTSSHQ
jgi:hypothetical protein